MINTMRGVGFCFLFFLASLNVRAEGCRELEGQPVGPETPSQYFISLLAQASQLELALDTMMSEVPSIYLDRLIDSFKLEPHFQINQSLLYLRQLERKLDHQLPGHVLRSVHSTLDKLQRDFLTGEIDIYGEFTSANGVESGLDIQSKFKISVGSVFFLTSRQDFLPPTQIVLNKVFRKIGGKVGDLLQFPDTSNPTVQLKIESSTRVGTHYLYQIRLVSENIPEPTPPPSAYDDDPDQF